jgi:hypothetical protein
MRIGRNILSEARRDDDRGGPAQPPIGLNPKTGRPNWMDDAMWNQLSPERRKEVVAKEKATQERAETLKNQDEQKTKYTVGTSPTSDNLQDYFRNIDRLGAEARAAGEDIGLRANREIGARIAAERTQAKQAAEKTSQEEAQARINTALELGQRGGTSTSTSEEPAPPSLLARPDQPTQQQKPLTSAQLVSRGVQRERALRNAGIDPATATDQDIATADAAIESQKVTQKEATAKAIEASRQRMKDTGKRGTVTTASGEKIDVGALLGTDVKALQTPQDIANYQRKVREVSGFFGKQEAAGREEARQQQAEKNRATRLQNISATALQAELQKDPSSALKQQAWQDYLAAKGGKPEQAEEPEPSVSTPAIAPQTGQFGGGQTPSVTQPKPITNPYSTPPTTTPKGTTEGTPTGADVHGGIQVASTKPDAAVRSVANVNKPQLYAAASEESGKRKPRLTAKKSTGAGVQQVMTEANRFERGELVQLLEASGIFGVGTRGTIGNPLGIANIKNKAKAIKDATKGVSKKSIRNLMAAYPKDPQDAVAYLPGQTAWSKGKGVRTAATLMKNPALMNVLGLASGMVGPVGLAKVAGFGLKQAAGALLAKGGKLAGLGSLAKAGADVLGGLSNTPEAEAKRAIALASVIGDPRVVNAVSPGEVVDYVSGRKKKKKKKDEDSTI